MRANYDGLLPAARRHAVPTAGWPLLIVVALLPALWPFLSHSGYWMSHDGAIHLFRLLSLQDAWQQGVWYPRLFPDFAFGYGFAVLHFYGPLSYYVALALAALLPPTLAMKATFALSYPLAALAMWWLARDLWRGADVAPPNEAAGVAAALAYSYLPYHMADVQLRGALAESWAFVWLPLVAWALWRVRFWPLLLALAALILTHNLSVVLALLPLGGWALLALKRHPRPRAALFVMAGAGVGALAVTLFYWLPVLLESRYVLLSQDVGGLGFARHLAAWREWVAPAAEYRYFPDQGRAAEYPLSWAQLALMGLAIGGLALRGGEGRRGPLLFWWAVLAGSLWLLTPASFPVWERFVFPFGLVQYPWRWLALTTLATALVVSGPLAAIGTRWRGWYAGALAVGLLWLALSSVQHLPFPDLDPEVARHPAPMWALDAANGQVGATWTAEFLPLTVREQRWALARAPEEGEAWAPSPLRARAVGGDGFTLWVEVEAARAAPLTFPRFAYPSMRATVDGNVVPLEARGALGLATVEVPAGRHRVQLQAEPLAAWGWGRFLLWLPTLLLLFYGARRLPRRWRVAAALGVPLLWGTLWLARPGGQRIQPLIAAPAAIGEQAQLLGLRDERGSVRAGETVPVRLLWFALQQSDLPYVTFVHLTAEGGGAPLVQHDSSPNLGTVPVARWLPGQLVEDLHLIDLPADLPAGRYELWAGMYLPTDEGVLPVVGDSGERRLVGTLEVKK